MNVGFVPPQKERLILKMTPEERGYFSSLLEIADKNMTGKLEGKTGANFLKKSGLPTDVLKRIWLIAAQTDCKFLERDEFYIALRLVALAQNNMECSPESIRLNHPLPPLPKFDLKSEEQMMGTMSNITASSTNMGSNIQSAPMNMNVNNENIFSLGNKEIEGYQNVFFFFLDMQNSISIIKAKQIWSGTGVSNDTMNYILSLMQNELKDQDSLNDKEFHVATHLIYKTINMNNLPQSLPNELKTYLSSTPSQNQIPSEEKTEATTSNDIEAVLLKEFNMKPIVHVDKKSNMNHYKGVAAVGLVNGVKNMLEQLKMMNAEAEEENAFLTKELEDSLDLYNSFIDDIEKVNKVLNGINSKKENIKNEIVDYRRKINIEKDNMAKISVNMKLIQDEIKE